MIKEKAVQNGKVVFSDISGHWAKNYIETLTESKIVSGFPDGSFKPENKKAMDFNREHTQKLQQLMEETIKESGISV